MENEYRICTSCVLDTTVPEIEFDENGKCNYCKIHEEVAKAHPAGEAGKNTLENIVNEIKTKGKNKEYDCIVGVSGGTDSTYTMYLAKKMGLRPLAVHFDNGWNSDIAVTNIKNATSKLNIDLYTVVADWEEFKDLQLAFLKASVPDAEIPTDYAIISVLLDVAAKEGVQYILEGHSFRAEGTTPIGWTYMDGRYINSIYKMFGNLKIKSFPILTLSKLLDYVLIKRIRFVRLLENIDYSKKEAKEVLKSELEWVDYGGHHHESVYTQFFQSYLLTRKFNIDKRKREYSARIRSGKMTREEAINKIQEAPYFVDKENVEYTISKLGLIKEEFDEIMALPPKSFVDYPTYYPIIQRLRFAIKIACKINLLPPVFYYKYGTNISMMIKNHWKNFYNSNVDLSK